MFSVCFLLTQHDEQIKNHLEYVSNIKPFVYFYNIQLDCALFGKR